MELQVFPGKESMVPSNFGLGVDFLKAPLWDSQMRSFLPLRRFSMLMDIHVLITVQLDSWTAQTFIRISGLFFYCFASF